MSARDWLLELLFPTRCIVCRRLLGGGAPRVCPDCLEKLPYTANGGRKRGDFFSACVSPLYYEGALREAILRYKFQGCRAYAEAFGTLLASCIYQQLDADCDLVTWVPLDSRRLRERGYDQTRLLTEAACRALKREPQRLLVKTKHNRAQSVTGAPERRRANVAGAYRVVDPALVEGKTILLIDDIVTTGSTLSECAKTLLLAGADEVFCAALARTR